MAKAPRIGEILDGYRFVGGDPASEESWEPFDDKPSPGDILDGYRFKGGDPASQSSWEPADAKKKGVIDRVSEALRPDPAPETETFPAARTAADTGEITDAQAAADGGTDYWTGGKKKPAPVKTGSVTDNIPSAAPVGPPIRPEVRNQLEYGHLTADPAKKAAMEADPGWRGQAVRLNAPGAQARQEILRKDAIKKGATPEASQAFADRNAVVADDSDLTAGNYDWAARDEFKNAGIADRAAAKTWATLSQSGGGAVMAALEAMGADPGEIKDVLAKTKRRQDAIGESREGATYLEKSLENVLVSIGTQAPAMARTVLGGGAGAASLLYIGAQTAGQEYAEGRAAGLSPAEAMARASAFGAAEVIGEKFGLGNFAAAFKKAIAGNPTVDVMKELARYAAKEVPGELLTTALQFGTDKTAVGLNKDAGIEEFVKQMGDTVVQTVMQVGITSGTAMGANRLAQAGQTDARRLSDAINAEVAGSRYTPEGVDAAAVDAMRNPAAAPVTDMGLAVERPSPYRSNPAFTPEQAAATIAPATSVDDAIRLAGAALELPSAATPVSYGVVDSQAASLPLTPERGFTGQATGEKAPEFEAQEAARALQTDSVGGGPGLIDFAQQAPATPAGPVVSPGSDTAAQRAAAAAKRGTGELMSTGEVELARQFDAKPAPKIVIAGRETDVAEASDGELEHAGKLTRNAATRQIIVEEQARRRQPQPTEEPKLALPDNRAAGGETLVTFPDGSAMPAAEARARQIQTPDTQAGARKISVPAAVSGGQDIAMAEPGEAPKASVADSADFLRGRAEASPEERATSLDIARGERKVDEKGYFATGERQRLVSAAEAAGKDAREIEQVVRDQKARFPARDGWAPVEFSKIDDAAETPGKAVQYKVVPWSYHVPPGKTMAAPAHDRAHADALATKMVREVDGIVKKAKAGDGAAKAIVDQMHWYKGFTKQLRQKYGGFGAYFADVLGATSPQTDVTQNFKNARHAASRFLNGDYDVELRKLEKHLAAGKSITQFPSADKIRKLTGELFGTNSGAAMQAMLGVWREARSGDSPKARNFAKNLTGDSDAATIDSWAARTLQRLAGKPRIPPIAEAGVTGRHLANPAKIGGAFGFGQLVFEKAAAKLKAAGVDITPADLHAMMWFSEKALWTKNNWTSAAGEDGSFEAEIAKTDTDRYQGLMSVQQGGEAPAEDAVAAAKGSVEAVLKADSRVEMHRVIPTEGGYMDDTEQSLDVEVVADQEWDPMPLVAEMVREAAKNKQDSVGLSRVVRPDEENANARPGVEVYLRKGASKADVMAISQALRDTGAGGFTLAVDPRARRTVANRPGGEYIGIRVQYVPEIFIRAYHQGWVTGEQADTDYADLTSGDDARVERVMQAARDALHDALVQARENPAVSHAEAYDYDTLLIGKESYDGYAATESGGLDQEAGGQAWPGESAGERLQGAARRHATAVGVDPRSLRGGGERVEETGQEDGQLRRDGGQRDGEGDAGAAEGLRASQTFPVPQVSKDTPVFVGREQQPDAVTVVAVRYGHEKRTSLNGRSYGKGVPGQEFMRIQAERDPALRERLLNRVYFYAQTADELPKAESIITGINVSRVKFTNLYDLGADPRGFKEQARQEAEDGPTRTNIVERLIMDAGFDGYLAKNAIPSPALVLLDIQGNIPAEFLGYRHQADQKLKAAAKADNYDKAHHEAVTNAIAEVVARAGGKGLTWPSGTVMHVVPTERSVPAGPARVWLSERAPGSIEGFYDPGSKDIWIISKNLPSVDRAIFVATAHEVFHAGIRNLLGPKDVDPVLVSIYQRNANVRALAARKVADGMSVALATEETLADMPDRGEVKGWDKLLALIKNFLAKLGIVRWTDEQVETLVAAARASVRGEGPVSVTSGDAAIAASEKAPVFYSELSRQIAATKSDNMPAPQWKALINNLVAKGVKKDEIEWSGVQDWLDIQGEAQPVDEVGYHLVEEMKNLDGEWEQVDDLGYYSRTEAEARAAITDELLAGAERNAKENDTESRISVKKSDRVSFGKTVTPKVSRQQILDYLANNGVQVKEKMLGAGKSEEIYSEYQEEDEKWYVYNARDEVLDAFDTEEEAENFIEHSPNAKFAQYTLPGGTNYRELLLTIPEKNKRKVKEYVVVGAFPQDGFETREAAQKYIDDLTKNIADSGVESLSAQLTRFPLSIHEQRESAMDAGNFQSTHFDTPNILAHVRFNERADANGKRILFIEEIQSDWAQKGKKDGFGVRDAEYTIRANPRRGVWDVVNPAGGVEGIYASRDEAQRVVDRSARPVRGVPPAPFVTKTEAWVALALKRMVRYAADNGFDGIAWTTGEQQADRYSLAKQVKWLDVAKNKDGTFTVTGRNADDRVFSPPDNIPANKLDEWVGKDLADRILTESEGKDRFIKQYKDLDLKVGGEGMIAFYDRIVPNVAKDVLKKVGGGQVGVVPINFLGTKYNGYVAYEEGTGALGHPAVMGVKPDGTRVVLDQNGDIPAKVKKLMKGITPTEFDDQPGFYLTPEMKAKAMQGMPLFSPKPDDFARSEAADIADDDLDFTKPRGLADLAGIMGKAKGTMKPADATPEEFRGSLPFQRALDVMKANAEDEWAFKYGTSDSRDWNTIVKEMRLDDIVLNVGPVKRGGHKPEIGIFLHRKRLTPPIVDFSTENPAADTELREHVVAYVAFGEGKIRDWQSDEEAMPMVWVDSSALQKGEGGKAIYQLIYTWAANNGYVFVPDPAGVSPAAVEARVANALSAALRLGTTRYMEPFVPKEQVNGHYQWTVPQWLIKGYEGWTPVEAIGDAADEHNMRLLMEAQLAMANDKLKRLSRTKDKIVDDEIGLVDNLAGFRYDYATEKIVYEDSREPVDAGTLDRIAEALVPPGTKVSGGDRAGRGAGAGVPGDGGSGQADSPEAGTPSRRGARAALVRAVVIQSAVDLTGPDARALANRVRNDAGSAVGTPRGEFLASRRPDWVRNGSPQLQSAASKIDTYAPAQTIGSKLKALQPVWKEAFVQNVFDAYAPLKRLGRREYILARMTKSADAALEATLLYGKPVLGNDGVIHGQLDNKGFLGHLKDLQGEHDRFLMWVAGNRADRLKGQGRENLFDNAEISAMMALDQGRMPDGSSRRQAFANAQLALNAYNKAVLDVAEKAGLIDGAARKVWESEFYVPFFRMDEASQNTGILGATKNSLSGPSAMVKGLVRQKAFEKLKGGTENLGDLLDNTMRNWSHLISAALANQAAVASLKKAEQMGIATRVPSGTKGATYVMENGQQVWYDVSDTFVLDAVSALESASFKALPMQVMGKFKHYLTLGVTVSPTFRVRNLMRDSISAIAQNDLSYNAAGNVFTGWAAMDKSRAEYQEALFNGAIIRFGQLTDGKHAEHAKRLIEAGVPGHTILNSPAKAKAALGAAWDWWQETGDRAENANRMARYLQGLARGESALEAAYASRDMLDFALQGSNAGVRFLTQIVPFMNARLQGLYKLGRAAKEDKARFGAVAGAVSVLSVALLLAYMDDDEWKKREDWDRDAFWWFRIGDVAYRVPKPFEIGAIGTIAERSFEAALSDEMTGKRMRERMVSMIGDTFAMNPTPQLFKPMLDLYSNKDSFSGRQIETRGMENLTKGERAGPNTTLLAKGLSKAITAGAKLTGADDGPISPVQADHLLRAYFGWLGSHVAMAVDLAAEPFMEIEKPSRKLGDTFVIGDFAKDLPSGRSRYTEEFYKQAKAIQEVMGDIKHAREAGDAEKIRQIYEERADEVALAKFYAATERKISTVSKRIRQVRASNLSADAKREQLDALEAVRNEFAKGAAGAKAALRTAKQSPVPSE